MASARTTERADCYTMRFLLCPLESCVGYEMSNRTQPSSGMLLTRRITALASSLNATWGIYIRFLDNGDEICINADRQMDTMSLIKVPVMVTLMRMVDRGEVGLTERITLRDRDKRLGSGVLRLFDEGATFCLRDAARLMIAVSDNTATDLCLSAVGGIEAVNACMADLGIDGIQMTGSVLDWSTSLAANMDPEFEAISPEDLARRGYPPIGELATSEARKRYHFEGGRPFSLGTPRAFGKLLLRMHQRTCASAPSCDLMLEILTSQQLRNLLPRFISGTRFAHKTGNFDPFIASDIAIATPWRGSPVIMCLLTARFSGSRTVLEDCIGRISELVILEAERR